MDSGTLFALWAFRLPQRKVALLRRLSMSAARRSAVVVCLTLAITLFAAAGSFAQTGGGNPSGGTGTRPSVIETEPGLPSSASIDVMFRSWIATLVSRQITSGSVSTLIGNVRTVMIRRGLAR